MGMTLNGYLSFLIALFSLCMNGQIQAQSDTTQINKLFEESENLSRAGEYEEALKLLLETDSLANALNYEEGLAKSLTGKADIYIDQNRFEEALNLIELGIELYPESAERLQFHNLRGSIYSNRGNDNLAVQEFEKARKFLGRLQETEKNRMDIGLMQNLAVVYNNLGQKEISFDYYLDVIERAKQLQDTAILTVAYNNIGQAYNAEFQLDRAQYYLEKSLDLAKSQNNKTDIYRAHLNYANVLSNQEKYVEALEHYEIAEKLFNELRPNAPPAIILHNKGSTLAKLGRYQEAEDMLNTSLQLCIDNGINEGMYHNYLVLGNMYLELRRYEEAINNLRHAVDLAQNNPSISSQVSANEALHKAYAEAGQYEQAYETFKTFKAYSDSLSDINKERELSGAENRIELNRQNEINQLLEEKQSQQEQKIRNQYYLIAAAFIIILLIVALWLLDRKRTHEKEKLVRELQERKNELEELNKAKDRVFAIVSHDLRSPLTSVQGVLELVKDEIIKGEELNYLVEGIESSLKQNVGVIEELLAWAKKQLSGFDLEVTQVELQTLMDDVISSQSFLALQKKIKMKAEVTQQKVYADANALRIIFRNLISNAIKYTEVGGRVKVYTEDRENVVRIMVSDDGTGIPESDKDKIFKSISWTRMGTDKEVGSGFGLSLSKEFVEKMNGRIWYESEEGVGTTFFVEIPKN